jgi:hypothetical protein
MDFKRYGRICRETKEDWGKECYRSKGFIPRLFNESSTHRGSSNETSNEFSKSFNLINELVEGVWGYVFQKQRKSLKPRKFNITYI